MQVPFKISCQTGKTASWLEGSFRGNLRSDEGKKWLYRMRESIWLERTSEVIASNL